MNSFLLGKTLPELEGLTEKLSMPKYSVRQIAHWLYQKRAVSIEDMTDISLVHRKKLSEQYSIGRSAPCDVKISCDGAKKYLFTASGEKKTKIESVYIPDNERATLCISSQAGCRMGCKFCMTAKMGLAEQLSAADILNQIFSIPESSALTNIVFMGMGEPLDNLQETLQTLEIITAPWGMGWSPSRVTLSTIGIHGGLKEFLQRSQCHLAVSLHSPFGEERQALMPMQKIYPVNKTIDIIRRCSWTHQRRVSFEYILFDGVNDSVRHAAAIVRLLDGLECRINLIKFHQIPQSSLRGSPPAAIENFQRYLKQKGVIATLRSSRGEDILAACGMLSTKQNSENKTDEKFT